jgi:outer membrane receptor protein involved in Fe transport
VTCSHRLSRGPVLLRGHTPSGGPAATPGESPRRPLPPRLPALAAALAALAAPAAAQAPFDLGEITLFANRVETPVDATGAAVIVVTEDELRAAGDILLSAFLARLPGVTVTQDGPIGSQASIRIRGADAAYVAVIVDGIRVTDPSAPQVRFDFGSLRASDVARIEVVKGSQSALYGGSAAGGVVVVTTRRAREPGFRQQVTLEAGSRETAGLTHALTQKGARHELAFTASHFGTAGFSAADARDGTPEADGHRATRLSLTGRFELSDTFAPGFAAFGQRTRSDQGLSAGRRQPRRGGARGKPGRPRPCRGPDRRGQPQLRPCPLPDRAAVYRIEPLRPVRQQLHRRPHGTRRSGQRAAGRPGDAGLGCGLDRGGL